MNRSSLQQIFDAHIQTLALTLRPATITHYQRLARQFLFYLHGAFPEVCLLSQLRRDPHLLGWFHWLSERVPPLRNETRSGYLVCLRRLLDDLTANGHSIQPDLIRREDFPPLEQYLPKPLSLADDRRLQRQLRRTDGLLSNALLLASPAFASANASICRWTVCIRSARTNGLCMSRSANCTPNASCRPIPLFERSWLVFWLCALWPRPHTYSNPRASCCLVSAATTPSIGLWPEH